MNILNKLNIQMQAKTTGQEKLNLKFHPKSSLKLPKQLIENPNHVRQRDSVQHIVAGGRKLRVRC